MMVTPTTHAPAVPTGFTQIEPTAEQITAARNWLSDCQWADVDADLIAEMADLTIWRAIQAHYQGGWAQFLRDSLTATEHPELTLYLIHIEEGVDEDDRLILGRDNADHAAAELFCRPDVLEVSCTPLAWGTTAEHDAIFDTNAAGLHKPVAAIATERNVDFDPENFDVIALLDHLRGLQRVPTC